MNRKQRRVLIRIIITVVLMVVLQFIPAEGWVRFALYMVPYLVIGYDILRKAALGVFDRQLFDENFLMAIATVGALAIAVTDSGDYIEAVAVMLFYQTGELFQSCAVGKSRRSISELMDIRPDYANVEVNGQLTKVSPDEVEVGSIIVVQPGEKIPIDGVVAEGCSSLNTVALTGESIPCDVGEGDEVISGSINMTGVLKVRTDKEFGESAVSRILELVENAGSHKSRSEAFISRFAKVYTPAVCICALALAILPPLFRQFVMSASPDWSDWVYRALTFLVISCPCALVISIPLSFFAGIGGASREGILVKGSDFIEALAKTDTVVFDKTGTLTQGVFEVNSIHHSNDERLLEYAAHAEMASSHPISRSLQRAYGKPLERSRVTDIREMSGHGVMAVVDGKNIAVGNSKLMLDMGLEYKECHSAGTIIHVAIDGAYSGHIVISDRIKPTSAEALMALSKAGVTQTVMLTGDTESAAKPVAQELGISRMYSGLLPEDKVRKVEELLREKRGGKLAFVGDGINDAPVLSRADIGISMGAIGSDAAIEAADVVLMDDDLRKLSKAIRISRKCMNIVRQNIVFALGIKLVCLVLGALGIANMWLAIFSDVGVMVIAVLNAIRAMYVKNV